MPAIKLAARYSKRKRSYNSPYVSHSVYSRYKFTMIAIILMAVFAGYCLGTFAFLSRFPSEIRLTEFTAHSLNIGLPLQASFQSETASVAKVNDTPITGSLSVTTRRPLTIKTDGAGTAEMTIGVFGLPMRRIALDVMPDIRVIPLGNAIGVRINTDGVMVLGTSSFLGIDGTVHNPSVDILRAGDLIYKIDGIEIKCKEDLRDTVAASTGDVTVNFNRNDVAHEVIITPAAVASDGVRRIGTWVRDSTKGIGTLTFYNPETGTFGALGHGIVDVDTKKLMSVKSGVIMPSTVTDVQRGVRGVPGELTGTVDTSRTLGQIALNNESGIYGTVEAGEVLSTHEAIPIAFRALIEEGPATLLTTVNGAGVQEFEIQIETVNRFAQDAAKGMVIRITDPNLLNITGGIVQGMSGSPIIQNGRLIGAVTHVFVQDPTKGYGIFIESMMTLP